MNVTAKISHFFNKKAFIIVTSIIILVAVVAVYILWHFTPLSKLLISTSVYDLFAYSIGCSNISSLQQFCFQLIDLAIAVATMDTVFATIMCSYALRSHFGHSELINKFILRFVITIFLISSTICVLEMHLIMMNLYCIFIPAYIINCALFQYICYRLVCEFCTESFSIYLIQLYYYFSSFETELPLRDKRKYMKRKDKTCYLPNFFERAIILAYYYSIKRPAPLENGKLFESANATLQFAHPGSDDFCNALVVVSILIGCSFNQYPKKPVESLAFRKNVFSIGEMTGYGLAQHLQKGNFSDDIPTKCAAKIKLFYQKCSYTQDASIVLSGFLCGVLHALLKSSVGSSPALSIESETYALYISSILKCWDDVHKANDRTIPLHCTKLFMKLYSILLLLLLPNSVRNSAVGRITHINAVYSPKEFEFANTLSKDYADLISQQGLAVSEYLEPDISSVSLVKYSELILEFSIQEALATFFNENVPLNSSLSDYFYQHLKLATRIFKEN